MIARENPFRADRVLACRYRPQSVGWDELIDRIQRHRYRAAIIGPEGTGKTTLLEDLAPRLDAMGHSLTFATGRGKWGI
jgi:MoxR-like ATPase